MKRRTFCYALLALTTHRIPARAAAPLPSPHTLLMEASGLAAQFGRYANVVAVQLETQLEAMGMDKPRTSQIIAAFRKRFQERVFLPALHAQLKSNLNESDVYAALRWLTAPDGQAITAAEITSLDDGVRQRFPAFQKQLAAIPMTRVAQVRALQDQLGSVNTELAFQTKLVGALDHAALLLHEPTAKTTPEELEQEARARLDGAREEIARHNLDFALFRYRDIPDDSLKHYEDFLRTAPGGRYQSAVDASIQEVLAVSYTRFHADLRGILTTPKRPVVRKEHRTEGHSHHNHDAPQDGDGE